MINVYGVSINTIYIATESTNRGGVISMMSWGFLKGKNLKSKNKYNKHQQNTSQQSRDYKKGRVTRHHITN